MHQIKLAIFDMAGTTVKDENEVEHCIIEAAKASNLPYQRPDVLAMMGWPKPMVFRKLWEKVLPNTEKEIIERQTETSHKIFKEILEEHYRTVKVEPTTGCLQLFDWLKEQRIKIALTTGFDRTVTNIILKRLGWFDDLDENHLGSKLINFSVTSDEVQHGRPAPDMIFKCMKMLGIQNPKEVVNIGDTPSDLESGFRANCLFSLGVTNGTHSYEQLSACENNGLLDNLLDLKEFLNNQ